MTARHSLAALAAALLTLTGCIGDDGDSDGPAPDVAATDGARTDFEPPPDSTPPFPDGAIDLGVGVCQSDDDCEGARRCLDGRCVACLGDDDCVAGYLCEADECVEGCRADQPCPAGAICEAGACVPGCSPDAPCPAEDGCVDGACVACDTLGPDRPPECPEYPCACIVDEECLAGAYCLDACTCEDGCRDDASCADGERCDLDTHTCGPECAADPDCPDGICDDGRCIARGVGCRDDDGCNPGDRCEGDRCVPDVAACVADAYEPNDDFASATVVDLMEDGTRGYGAVGICPGDIDLYRHRFEAGDTLRARLQYGDPAPLLTLRLVDAGGALIADGLVGNASTWIEHTVDAAGDYAVEVRGADPAVRIGYGLELTVEAAPMCVDTDVYPDRDADGFGVDAGAESRCLEGDDTPAGFARRSGDCRPRDIWANPDAAEICGDWVDDDCDGRDAPCPESQPAVGVPDWRCEDDAPPPSVYAYARFDDGGGYFRDRGCFVFFEGLPGEFYVKRALDRASDAPRCLQPNGCTCPSLNGWPSYDRRLYAFTLAGDVADCAPIEIIDHGGETQPVSNDCRKYLYQLHFYDIPYSFVAAGRETLDRRLDLFPTVEVACAADTPHANLPYQSLLTAPIVRNPAYAPQRPR